MVDRDRTGPIRDVRLRPVHWLMVLLALLTGAIHVYVGFAAGETAFFVLGAILLSGLVVFFTRYWSPALYVVGALYVGVLIVVWLLSGMQFLWIGLLDAIVQGALLLVFVYLTLTETGSSAPAE